MSLKDHSVKSSNTLIVTKPGITLNVTDPKVCKHNYYLWLFLKAVGIDFCDKKKNNKHG